MKSILRAVVVFAGALIFITWAQNSRAQMDTEHQHHSHGHHHGQPAKGKFAPSGEIINGVRVIRMEAFRYAFKPDPVVVKKGEKVRLLVTSTDVVHGIMIREFGINEKLPPGKEVVIEFTPDKTGTFTIHCSVFCGPGHGRMHGALIVQ